MDSVKTTNLTYYISAVAVDDIPVRGPRFLQLFFHCPCSHAPNFPQNAFFACADSVMWCDLILSILVGLAVVAALVLAADGLITEQFKLRRQDTKVP